MHLITILTRQSGEKCFREKRYEKTLEKDCVLLVDMYNKKYLTLELET